MKFLNISIIIALFCTASFAENIKENNKNTKPVSTEKKLEINISGSLKDYNDKPVKEGFVMLQNHPRLCTTTDGKGQFKITGNIHALPDTLLASWAGCETAEIPITNAVMKKLNIKLKAEDRDYTKIEVGCAILASRAGADYKIHHTYEKLKDTTRKITKDEQVCVDAYQAFLKNKGEVIIKKILAGKELSADEAKYRYLLHAEISKRAGFKLFGKQKKGVKQNPYQSYCRPILDQAMKVMHKGYKGEQLTSEDIETLRLFRAIQAVFKPGNDDILSINTAGFNTHVQRITTPPVGKKYSDFSFLELDPILKDKAFSNYSSLSLTEFVRLESLADLFNRFVSVKLNEDGLLAPTPKNELRNKYWKTHEQIKSLSELVDAANKPVVLCWTVLEDRTYPSPEARFAEYLRRAYKDQIEVITVSAPSPIYGDMSIDEFRYFGPNPNAEPLLGLDTRFGEEDNTPMRHARIVKIGCMENPVISGPVFLEVPGNPYRAFATKGNTFVALLDKKGTKSYDHHNASFSVSEGYWEKNPFNFSYYQGENDYGCFEQELRALLKNKGVYDDAVMGKTLFPTYPSRLLAKHDQMEVKRIDHTNNIIYAGWIKPTGRGAYPIIDRYGKCEPDIEFQFKISPDTRIVLRKKNGKAYWPNLKTLKKTGTRFMGDFDGVTKGLATLNDLQIGDRFLADFVINEKQSSPRKKLSDKIDKKKDLLPGLDMEKYAGKLLDTVRIQNFLDCRGRIANAAFTMGSLMPLYGKITKINGTKITVKIAKEDVVNMRGYQFWKQEEKNADPAVSEVDYARKTMPVINRWAEGSDKDRTYTFVVDRAVRITRNGKGEKTIKDLKVGDYVYIAYHMWYETQHQGKCDIYPETIMASSPIKKSKKLSPGTLNSNSYPKILQSKSEFKKENI